MCAFGIVSFLIGRLSFLIGRLSFLRALQVQIAGKKLKI